MLHKDCDCSASITNEISDGEPQEVWRQDKRMTVNHQP
jgi:hypothetical protein